jgi:hypothetical protein
MLTLTLPKYAGREGQGTFRPMTFSEARQLTYGQHVWIHSISGDARRVKINGAPKLWKRSPHRIEISLKYGLYEYARFDERDVANNRLLIEIDNNIDTLTGECIVGCCDGVVRE